MENASLPDLFSLTELTSKACGTCAVARLMNAQKHSAIVSFRESFIAKILPSYDTERHNWYPLRLQNRRGQRTLFVRLTRIRLVSAPFKVRKVGCGKRSDLVTLEQSDQ